MKNVTVKLEDELVRAARHEAVDAGQSLSTWLADLIRERLGRSGVSAKVAEVMGNDLLASPQLLGTFEEARRRALNYLDHPVALGEGEDTDPEAPERRGGRE
jgi:hypothetical protein